MRADAGGDRLHRIRLRKDQPSAEHSSEHLAIRLDGTIVHPTNRAAAGQPARDTARSADALGAADPGRGHRTSVAEVGQHVAASFLALVPSGTLIATFAEARAAGPYRLQSFLSSEPSSGQALVTAPTGNGWTSACPPTPRA